MIGTKELTTPLAKLPRAYCFPCYLDQMVILIVVNFIERTDSNPYKFEDKENGNQSKQLPPKPLRKKQT